MLGRQGFERVLAEGLVEHPLPGIELEDGFDGLVFEIDKAQALLVPSDLMHGQMLSLQARLLGGVAEIGRRHGVFFAASVGKCMAGLAPVASSA